MPTDSPNTCVACEEQSRPNRFYPCERHRTKALDRFAPIMTDDLERIIYTDPAEQFIKQEAQRQINEAEDAIVLRVLMRRPDILKVAMAEQLNPIWDALNQQSAVILQHQEATAKLIASVDKLVGLVDRWVSK